MRELQHLYGGKFNNDQERLDYLQKVKLIVIKKGLYEEAAKMRNLEKELKEKLK